MDQPGRRGDPLEGDLLTLDQPDILDRSGQMCDGLAGDDFARAGESTQSRGHVESGTAVTSLYSYRFTRIEPDADTQGQLGIAFHLVDEGELQLYRCAYGVARRGKHGQRFVTAQLDDVALVRLDRLARDLSERGRQPPCRLVAVTGRERGIAAHIGDQEGQDRGRAHDRGMG